MALSQDLTKTIERGKTIDQNESGNSLIGLMRKELRQALIEIGIPEKQSRMRCSQIWHWLYVRA